MRFSERVHVHQWRGTTASAAFCSPVLAELASANALELHFHGAEKRIQVRNLEWPLCCNSWRSQPEWTRLGR